MVCPDTRTPAPATPLYDVRPAGTNLGLLAGTIGGFAITAVVLLSQAKQSDFCEHSQYLRAHFGKHCVAFAERFSDRAAIGFILAVFGSTVAAIELFGVAGEREPTPRSMAISICARTGFVISLSVVFWGLSVVAALAFGEASVMVARLTSIGWALAVPPLLGFVYVESTHTPHTTSRTRSDASIAVPLRSFFGIAWVGLAVLIGGFALWSANGSRLTELANGYVDSVFVFGIVLVLLSMVGVLAYGRNAPTRGMSRAAATGVIAVCCLFIAAVTQLLPP